MTLAKNLLVELFVEELPPKALKALGEAFAEGVANGLVRQQLKQPSRDWTAFASPRRLAVHLPRVAENAADRVEQVKLMPVSVGLAADGQATPALLKKLASLGADVSVVGALQRKLDGKAEVLFLDRSVKGATLAEGLQKALDEAIAGLPIPKVMQYQLEDGWTSVNFVRPAHGLVALHGADVVPVRALGLEAGRQTQGHRFEAQMTPVVLQDADHYARQLEEQGAVIASFAARHGETARQLQAAAAKEGLTPIDDAALLDEVTALVERPNVLLCRFEEQFLEVPQECLILTMKVNQKYFPLLDSAGRLTNRFLVVSNIRPDDPSRVIEGNERVVRPRLADAKFFFDQDRKRTLESRLPGLDKVIYHARLGSQAMRNQRVVDIAKFICGFASLGADAVAVERAARLSKADLLTDMVGEFPELQGVMGAYYARHDGESDEVAHAIREHYSPRFSGDAIPVTLTGTVVALADKLETVAGLFAIGQVPTGDKDPFALRRHAVGILRICTERPINLPLTAVVGAAMATFRSLALGTDAPWQILNFFYDRLAVMMKDSGFTAQEVEAVVSLRPDAVAEVPARLAAVRAFTALPEAASLAAANKRIANILKKSEAGNAAAVDAALFAEDAERRLHDALKAARPLADALFEKGDYAGSLRELAALKAPVDAFFDGVMVNAEDPALRGNRLALLGALHSAMNRVADLSRLAT